MNKSDTGMRMTHKHVHALPQDFIPQNAKLHSVNVEMVTEQAFIAQVVHNHKRSHHKSQSPEDET